MQEVVASLENINKSFSGVPALKNVNFDLRKGEVHALVGGNGAGKSTLMKILNGVYEKDSGIIRINGKEVTYKDVTDAWKYGVRMIFQELSLSPTLSVSQNIFLTREIKKGLLLDKKAMRKKAQEALDSMSIDAKPDDIIKELPVGTCQLIEIAKALSTDAKILILDEPTASLTEKETKTLFDKIRLLKQQGISFINISHRMKEILEISDRISVLRDGELVKTLDSSEYTLETLIGDVTAGKSGGMQYKQSNNKPGEELFRVENITIPGRVKDVSFSIRCGEVVGIAGLMGSGRTETVEMIFGLRQAGRDTRFYMHGQPVRIRSVSDAIKQGIALIPEDRRREGLVLTHSVEQNTCLTNLEKLRTARVLTSNKKGADFCNNCVSKYGIKASNIHKAISHLSGGNQQKAVVAKWLETNPRLLIMDEPTAGVDIGAKSEIINLVRDYASQGNAVLFISSEMQEMLAACDRILVYSSGCLQKELLRETIQNEEALEHAIQD